MIKNKSWTNQKTHYLNAISDPWYGLLMKIQNQISLSTMDFYKSKNIITAYLPVTTGSISSPMGLGSDSLPIMVNICGIDTYLADSMQFMLEYSCRLCPEGTYYIMPSFRGEQADTRHLCQFYHSEAEIPGTLDDIIALVENYISYLSQSISFLLGDEIMQFTGDIKHIEDFANLKKGFPRIKYDDAIDLLKKEKNYSDEPFFIQCDGYRTITSCGEKKLLEIFNGVVWLTHFDYLAVPFYQALDKKTNKALNADLLFGIGEVVGSGERHTNKAEILNSLKLHQVEPSSYEWYITMKEKFPLKTSGFGMGIERFILWLLKHNDIRDCQILPRFNGEPIYI